MPPVPENPRTRQPVKRDLFLLLGIAGFTVCITLFYFLLPQPNSEPGSLDSATSLHAHPRAFPEFSLTDHRGTEFSHQHLRNVWSFIFFGYTHCPDICPLTLGTMNQVLGTLSTRDAIPAQGIFISVDPSRDTQPQLSDYVQYFDQKIIGLTGSDSELETLSQALGVVYSVPPAQDDAGYLVDHSAHIFLVTPNGNLLALFGTPHESQHIIDDFRTLNTYYNLQQGS